MTADRPASKRLRLRRGGNSPTTTADARHVSPPGLTPPKGGWPDWVEFTPDQLHDCPYRRSMRVGTVVRAKGKDGWYDAAYVSCNTKGVTLRGHGEPVPHRAVREKKPRLVIKGGSRDAQSATGDD